MALIHHQKVTGLLCLSMSRPADAVASFRRAHKLAADVFTYEGKSAQRTA